MQSLTLAHSSRGEHWKESSGAEKGGEWTIEDSQVLIWKRCPWKGHSLKSVFCALEGWNWKADYIRDDSLAVGLLVESSQCQTNEGIQRWEKSEMRVTWTPTGDAGTLTRKHLSLKEIKSELPENLSHGLLTVSVTRQWIEVTASLTDSQET
ncbi:uncharacterized protein LOC144341382 isoform X2 [Macaca mulatta]